jgi:hypothetical protein
MVALRTGKMPSAHATFLIDIQVCVCVCVCVCVVQRCSGITQLPPPARAPGYAGPRSSAEAEPSAAVALAHALVSSLSHRSQFTPYLD